MMSVNENVYDITLILKIKERTGTKKIKKILRNLRNLAEDELKEFSELKINKFGEKKSEIKNNKFKNDTSFIEFQHYAEDFKNPSSRSILYNDDEYERVNTPVTSDDNEEEMKQIDNSYFTIDE